LSAETCGFNAASLLVNNLMARNVFRDILSIHSRRIVVIIAILHFSEHSSLFAQRYLTTFGTVSDLNAGRNARGMVMGDFNGDGFSDIATYGGTQMYIRYQTPDTSEWESGNLFIGKTILAAAAGWCNHDRFSDLVIVTDNPLAIEVYLGKSSHRFVQSWKHELTEPFEHILVADINSDGKADILLYGKKQLGVSVFLGRGDGSFRSPTTIFSEYSFSALSITNINDDGINDVIAANWISNQVLIFSGFGKLKFSDPAVVQCSNEPSMFNAAFLDSDSNIDLVIGFAGSNTVQTFLGNGLGDFQLAQTITLDYRLLALAIDDVNGDGWNDIGVLEDSCFTVGLNDGKGKIEESVAFASGKAPITCSFFHRLNSPLSSVAILDTAFSRVRILYNDHEPVHNPLDVQYGLGVQPTGVLCADINHAGWDDVLVANTESRHLSLLLNEGKGVLGGQMSFHVSIPVKYFRYLPKNDTLALIVSFNPDVANLSIVQLNLRNYSHTEITLPTQGKTYVLAQRIDSITSFLHLFALEYENETHGTIIEYEQIAPTRFIERTFSSSITEPIIAATMCDYDNDGMPDIIYLAYDTVKHKESLYTARGIASEKFERGKLAFSIDEANVVSAIIWNADLNNDGIQDIVMNFREPENLLAVSLGRRDSSFTMPLAAFTKSVNISSWENLKFVDINNDGKKDIVLQNELNKNLQVLIGKGDGNLTPRYRLISTEGIGGFTFDDLDKDGTKELIITDQVNGVLKVFPLEEER
jgi:hypothetical protein